MRYLRATEIIKTKSTTVVARGWGRAEWGIIKFLLYKIKGGGGGGCTTL